MRLQYGTAGGDVATNPAGGPAAGSAWLVFDAPIAGTQISTVFQRGTDTPWPGGIVTADADGRVLFDLDADERVTVWLSQSTTGPRWEMRPSGEPLALPAGGALGEVLRTGADGAEWAPLPTVGGGSGNTVSAAHLATWSINPAGKKLITNGTRYDSFPVATARDDGTLVVAWSSNATHAGDGYVLLSRSTDQGATWSSPEMVGGDPADGRSQIVALSSLRDRTAMLTFTDGAPQRTGWLWVTSDPASWPASGMQVDWGTVGSVFPSSLVWLDDGTTDGVMLATEYGTEGIIVAKSINAGLSWQRLSTPLPPGQGWNETAISRTAAGDLIMLARNNGATDRIDILRSYDGGATWTEPTVAVATASGMPKVTLMPDGTLIGTIRDELQSDGRWTLIVSSDNGHHWSRMPVNDEWMMYGQIIPLVNGDALLVGANQNRAVTDQAWVWTMPLTLAPRSARSSWDQYAVSFVSGVSGSFSPISGNGAGELGARQLSDDLIEWSFEFLLAPTYTADAAGNIGDVNIVNLKPQWCPKADLEVALTQTGVATAWGRISRNGFLTLTHGSFPGQVVGGNNRYRVQCLHAAR